VRVRSNVAYAGGESVPVSETNYYYFLQARFFIIISRPPGSPKRVRTNHPPRIPAVKRRKRVSIIEISSSSEDSTDEDLPTAVRRNNATSRAPAALLSERIGIRLFFIFVVILVAAIAFLFFYFLFFLSSCSCFSAFSAAATSSCLACFPEFGRCCLGRCVGPVGGFRGGGGWRSGRCGRGGRRPEAEEPATTAGPTSRRRGVPRTRRTRGRGAGRHRYTDSRTR
jgi:hypothetical protein